MEIIGQGIVAVGWLSIVGLVLLTAVTVLGEHPGNCEELPFFGMLARHGMIVSQVEEAVGIEVLARAVRRCAFCARRSACGPDTVFCPNEPLLRRAKLRAS